MLQKVRRKFILISIALALLVFSSVTVSMVISTIHNRNKSVNDIINKYSYIAEETPQKINDQRVFVIRRINEEEPEIFMTETGPFADSEYFNDLVNKIISSKKDRGHIGNVYFRRSTKQTPKGQCFIIFGVDVTRELGIFKENIMLMLLLNVCGLVLISIIAWAASFWLTKPVEDALLKQKRFISDAGHELKTPLAIISANMEVLTSDIGENTWTENIKSQTQRMGELIGELLDLAKLEEGGVKVEEKNFDIGVTVTTTALQFEVAAYENGKRLSVIAEKDMKYVGDEESVRKLVSILTLNAVKYAKVNSVISINIIKAKDKYMLTVYNEGCDIEEKDKDRLFERFYRADGARDRATGGNGLGLAIAKGICETNKWKIFVDCKKNEFMKFTVLI